MASGAHCLYPPGVKIDFHQQEFDEILVPIHGCSVDVAVILPTGEVRREVLGKNLIAGEKLNISVPKGSFMGVRNLSKTDFSIISAFTSPAYLLSQSIFFKREKLLELFPQHTQTVLDFSSEVSQQATASE